MTAPDTGPDTLTGLTRDLLAEDPQTALLEVLATGEPTGSPPYALVDEHVLDTSRENGPTRERGRKGWQVDVWQSRDTEDLSLPEAVSRVLSRRRPPLRAAGRKWLRPTASVVARDTTQPGLIRHVIDVRADWERITAPPAPAPEPTPEPTPETHPWLFPPP